MATQAFADRRYGALGIELLAAGRSPQEALDELTAADREAGVRQVGVVAADGRSAAHTGSDCVPAAGHVTGDGFSAQANMMASPEVWPAMASAFERAEGSLAARLLDALDAAEAAGGDVRGRQSAALLVVPAAGDAWSTVVDLRVEDHPDPLAELRRLAQLARAYRLASEGDDLIGAGKPDAAGERYRAAVELDPGNHELIFWSGLAMVQAGELDRGVQRISEAIAIQPGWAALLGRLPVEIAPEAGAVLEALGLER